MAKRLKFRICKFFQSCRSKDSSSTVPSTPVPCFLPLTLPPQKPRHPSSLGRHVSSADCGFTFTSRSSPSGDVVEHDEPRGFRWQLQDKWHVVAKVVDHASTPRRKIYNSSVSAGCSASDNDDVLPLPPPRDRKKKKKKRRVGRKKTTSRFRISTSSADSCGLFSSDGYDDIEGGETETLVSSSRSFSTESSSLETIRETPSQHRGAKKKMKKKKKKKKKEEEGEEGGRGSISWSPARVSMLLRMVPCGVEGKVRESFAVVKRSEDPYEDFRRSMMEMILEKRMFEESDLEQLLHCFLSLNSTQHHALILKAFSEIWDALFATHFTQ